MAKYTINGKTIDTSKRGHGQSEREYVAEIFGISKEDASKLLKSSSGGSSSGEKTIPNTTNIITSDAQKAMEKLSGEAQNYILSQDYGKTLSSGDVKKFNSKFIDGGSLSSTKQNLTGYNLPDEAFNITTPQLIPGTPEYQAAMDKLSTAYFDVIQQQLNAGTEQEQAAAEYNWQTLKKSMEKNLNVSLSNDAFQAWGQVQGLKNQFANQGISNSGMQNETVDNYLSNVRRQDTNIRNEAQSKEDESQQSYYRQFATPEQIKKLVETDPVKAKSWGLMPSDEIKAAMNPAALKAKYPNMSDADIQKQISSILDANGNYRSSLYQKYMTGSNLGINTGNVGNAAKDEYGHTIAQSVTPSDTGYQDVQAAKELYLDLNAPLANRLKSYNERVELGAITPTEGAESGTASGTQFNKITPGVSDDPTLAERPKNNYTPGSMLSSAS